MLNEEGDDEEESLDNIEQKLPQILKDKTYKKITLDKEKKKII